MNKWIPEIRIGRVWVRFLTWSAWTHILELRLEHRLITIWCTGTVYSSARNLHTLDHSFAVSNRKGLLSPQFGTRFISTTVHLRCQKDLAIGKKKKQKKKGICIMTEVMAQVQPVMAQVQKEKSSWRSLLSSMCAHKPPSISQASKWCNNLLGIICPTRYGQVHPQVTLRHHGSHG